MDDFLTKVAILYNEHYIAIYVNIFCSLGTLVIGIFIRTIFSFFKKIWNTIRGKKELEPTGNNQVPLKGLDLKSVNAPIYIMTGPVTIQHPPNEHKANSKKEDDK